MINFNGVDFGKRRSEEVISFFCCSVYLRIETPLETFGSSRDDSSPNITIYFILCVCVYVNF